jgi:hypothetical protein
MILTLLELVIATLEANNISISYAHSPDLNS